jgi:DNA polymerase-1
LFSGGLTRTQEYNLRNAFVARPGYSMLSIDYKQQEMRMFAYISQDDILMKFVKEGKDIHMMIALKVWGDCGEKENKIHREWSKTIAFGLIYGMTTGSLEHKLGMTREEATKVIDDYWNGFPRIRPALFETVDTCKQNGFLRYWSGRIWREGTEMFMYKGMNAQVQGGCADLLSIAAMRTHKWLHQHEAGEIVSYIYDELLMEIKTPMLEQVATTVGKIMQIPDVLDLAFLTECKYGTTYGDLQNMELLPDGSWRIPASKEKA